MLISEYPREKLRDLRGMWVEHKGSLGVISNIRADRGGKILTTVVWPQHRPTPSRPGVSFYYPPTQLRVREDLPRVWSRNGNPVCKPTKGGRNAR